MSEEITFESAMQRLEEIVRLLESADLTLAEGMTLYKEGADKARFCRQKLEQAKVEIKIWEEGELNQEQEEDEA